MRQNFFQVREERFLINRGFIFHVCMLSKRKQHDLRDWQRNHYPVANLKKGLHH